MPIRPFSILRRLALLLIVTLGLGAPAAWAAERITLQVLATSDLHVNMMDYDYYKDGPETAFGLTRTATLIKAARAANPNTILLDNGDTIQGTPMGDWIARERGVDSDRPHPVIAALNLLAYDAAVLGNHEFNYGLDFLGKTYAGAKFPVLAGNVFKVDGDSDPSNDVSLYPPFTILERTLVDQAGGRHKVKIGVIGLLTPQIMVWDRDKLVGRVTTRDIIDTARTLVPKVRAAGADIVIALSHSGLSAAERVGGEEQAGAYLTKVEGIDAVITGHSHRVFPGTDYQGFAGADNQKGTINGKPLVMPGQFGSHLGVIDLVLERGQGGTWKVADGRAEARPIQGRKDGRTTPLVEPDPEVTALLVDAHKGTLDYIRRAVGRTPFPINSFFAFLGDSPGVELVAEAQRAYVEKALRGTALAGMPILSAAAPFKAGGRVGVNYFTDIPAGQLAIKNVADLYVYPNTLNVVKLTGAQVREWLEVSARVLNRIDPAVKDPQPLVNGRIPSYVFDIIDGVTYAIDLTQPSRYGARGLENPNARRIVDLRFEGRPVKDDQEFLVVTNNYRANGGGEVPGLDGSTVVYESQDTVQQAIVEYIRTRGVIDPTPDGTFRLLPINGDVMVTYATNPKALMFADGRKDITHIGPGEDGFTVFKVKLDGPAK